MRHEHFSVKMITDCDFFGKEKIIVGMLPSGRKQKDFISIDKNRFFNH